MPNEKGKKQNINKRRIDKVEYKTKVNLNKKMQNKKGQKKQKRKTKKTRKKTKQTKGEFKDKTPKTPKKQP